MHETAAAERSEGSPIALLRSQLGSAEGKGAKVKTTLPLPLLLSLFAIATLMAHPNCCQATPAEGGHTTAAVRFVPYYTARERGMESIDDNAILNGRRLFLSSSSLHSNPLPQPVFIPTLDMDTSETFESPLVKQKRRSLNQLPTDATVSGGNQRLLRIERNANHAAGKLFQIQTVGDLPMLRFGRRR